MINDKDIQLSKLSFTDKDFASLYPDLLDLASQLTNEWDPGQATNESDPGVVLLKEGAFIADHNNYNIDKNVLENFLPSATQDRSVRNITEMNGYTPRYYVSATGNVTFNYNPEDISDDELSMSFVIPPFTMVITNEAENIAYTQISSLTVFRANVQASCRFIEGTLHTLTINGSEDVLLENLDDNNRLYLPNVYIAQNGVFIKNKNADDSELWERNNYLLTQSQGSKIYKFDFDSSVNLPYIEFPSDIANLIENGLSVRYISTTGVNGNIKANTLTKIQTPSTYNLGSRTINVSEDFEVTNQTSFDNGKNPETIDEMYRSFKKVVGTFDTLVTTKDYSNAIYNLENELNMPIVSNDVVTDIRNDYNGSLNVITYDQYGEYFENISLNKSDADITTYNLIPNPSSSEYEPSVGDIYLDSGVFKVVTKVNPTVTANINSISYSDFVDATTNMSQYDLVIHALKAFSMSDYDSTKPSRALNKSFEPIENDTKLEIINSLNNLKCINHTFRDVDSDEVYIFKNYVPLRVTVTPYSKVTLTERSEIFQNIYKALSINFNLKKLLDSKMDLLTKISLILVSITSVSYLCYWCNFNYGIIGIVSCGIGYLLYQKFQNKLLTMSFISLCFCVEWLFGY